LRHHLGDLGKLPLRKLTPQLIQAHYAKELETQSATSVHHLHAILHSVLKAAVRQDILPRNPADFVEAPGKATPTFTPLAAAQVHTLLAAITDEQDAALVTLLVSTGLRIAEALGLKWADVTLDAPVPKLNVRTTLHRVNGEYVLEPPKSPASVRTVPIPPLAVRALTRWQAIQKAEQALVGDAWLNRFGLVFTSGAGYPRAPQNVGRHFKELLARAGLPQTTRIHDLRHTYATLLLEAGVNSKVVSELLGHASIAITLSIYSHVTPRMLDAAIHVTWQLFSEIHPDARAAAPVVRELHAFSHDEPAENSQREEDGGR
jgi:integrase